MGFSFLNDLFFFRFRDIYICYLYKFNNIRFITKTVKRELRISLEILKQCSSNLAPDMFTTKQTKYNTCCAVAMTSVLPLVLSLLQAF